MSYTNTYIPKEYKTKIIVGDVTVMLTKRFNWFQKRMLNVFFGFEVEDIKEG